MKSFEDSMPKIGQKLIYTKPTEFAFHTNVIQDEKLLVIGREYTLKNININSSSVYIWLEEIECYNQERNLPYFNLWAFNWEGKDLEC